MNASFSSIKFNDSLTRLSTALSSSKRWLTNSLTQHQTLISYCEPLVQLVLPQWTTVGYRSRVVGMRHETSDVFTLILKPSSRWPGFKAGQYVQISMERDGIRQTRIFSISSSPEHWLQTGQIELTIRVQDQGRMTPWMRESLATGATVSLAEAEGDFVLPNNAAALLLIAGGSGITPFRAMLGQLACQHSQRDITLLCYQRDRTNTLFQHEFERYQQLMPNLKISYLPSDEVGFICTDHIQSYCPDAALRQVMICGPTPMIKAARQVAADLAVPVDQISFEYFGAVPIELANSAGDDSFVRFERSNQTAESPSDDPVTLLEIAEQSGLNPLSGCRAGVCHQCKCTKKSGVVLNLLTGLASDTGQEDIQLCISVAQSDVVLDL